MSRCLKSDLRYHVAYNFVSTRLFFFFHLPPFRTEIYTHFHFCLSAAPVSISEILLLLLLLLLLSLLFVKMASEQNWAHFFLILMKAL